MKSKRFIKYIVYLFLCLGIIFSLLAAKFSNIIESGYSTKLYFWTIRPYSLVTGIFPFSLAELIVVCTVIIVVYKTAKVILSLIRRREYSITSLPNTGIRIFFFVAVLYLTFNLMWGLNYSRLTFAEISGLPVKSASVNELAEVSLHLTQWANELREQVTEDDQGVMMLTDGIEDMFKRAQLGYHIAAEYYPELGGKYGRPKGVMLSHYWSYTGIGGVFFPFTAEANVNIKMPHFLLPSTTTHEMAHQRGFAREDEANYIAYLTSTLHPDPDFQYSGVMLALTYAMNSLYRYDKDAWQEIRDNYSDGLNRDLQEWQKYRARYEGPVKEISTNVNNTYLKVNRQEDGVYSYGRMVDLLLAEFRIKNLSD
ncbi:MAG: DUF3810 domain-containing protein [Bacillota bacterium]|nr:DUF3810 domain-containing protein [Bacillota bacterium]